MADRAMRDWIDPEGVPVTILARGCVDGPPKDRAFAIEVARDLWRRRKSYDVVYFLMQGFHLAIGLPVARFLGKAILMKVGGSGVIPLMTRSTAGRLELRWLREWANRIMILNDGMKEEALQEGFPPEQIYWMPNPVDTDKFSPCTPAERLERRARFRIPSTAPLALYCGRLAPEKALP